MKVFFSEEENPAAAKHANDTTFEARCKVICL